MIALASHSSVKVVGANGQISLGKQFAGRQVLVEEREPGVWMVRTATVIPDNERWLHEPKAAADLRATLSAVKGVDTERFGLFAGSKGSEFALIAASRNSSTEITSITKAATPR